MAGQPGTIWESDNEARLLESRLAGFWNPDYLKHVIAPLLNLKPGARVLDVGSGTGCLTLLFILETRSMIRARCGSREAVCDVSMTRP